TNLLTEFSTHSKRASNARLSRKKMVLLCNSICASNEAESASNCAAIVWTLLDVKRTLRARRGRVDLERLTEQTSQLTDPSQFDTLPIDPAWAGPSFWPMTIVGDP